MSAEKCLMNAGFYPTIVPTPRNINSECGFSLLIKISKESLKKVAETALPIHIFEESYDNRGIPYYIPVRF